MTSYLFHILERLSLELGDVVNGYAQSVHMWFPIIHPNLLAARAGSLRDIPIAETASLILHILLVIPKTTTSSIELKLSQPLHKACKFIFSLLQTYRQDQLMTIQAGVLLAIHEHGCGLFAESYSTLATCADHVHFTGLNRLSDISPIIEEERRRLWSAIHFLDILFHHSDESLERPPLVRCGSGEKLPSDDDAWSQNKNNCLCFLHASVHTDTTGCFSQQVQAAHFLQRVLELTRNSSVPEYKLFDDEAWKLDSMIRDTTLHYLNNPSKDWESLYRTVIVLLQ